jgi:hypothetical protein
VFISTLHILFITLVKNCTNTPLPVAHVKSWSISIRTTACSRKPGSNLWMN